ncbi:hypothetical protein DYI20_06035 [Auritidibacter ignavus]|nr:hypothetical protein DYI20_06035 [Auritidibacter ignavus]
MVYFTLNRKVATHCLHPYQRVIGLLARKCAR